MSNEVLRTHKIVSERNNQRNSGLQLTEKRLVRERTAIEKVLAFEQCQLDAMKLVLQPLATVYVNPHLTKFLDGADGLGGYADTYAESEAGEPGTKIEMDQEKRIIRDHLDYVLNPSYIDTLRRDNKPLVIIEGGAGPDLRTFGTVSEVLIARAKELQEIPIQMLHVDISQRMAAITAAKVRTSGLPEQFMEHGLQTKIAVCHADVFDVLEKVPDGSLSYALLPFGVFSFGLDGKDSSQIMTNIRAKLRSGAGMLATVYNSQWRDYTELLEKTVLDINTRNHKTQPLSINELNPFVIRIADGEMQVGGGLAFSCTTFTSEEMHMLVASSGLHIDTHAVTPQGWAYMPDTLLNTMHADTNDLPSSHLMNYAKIYTIGIIEQAGADANTINALKAAIPNGESIEFFPAPYITITARR